MILLRFPDAGAAATALAGEVVRALQAALAGGAKASLAVPGGRTPVPFFEALRDGSLAWERVHITLTDERWVPEAHPASNAALVRGSLLKGAAGQAEFQPLYDGAATAEAGDATVWQSLAALPRPFAAVVLGMGEDGHFASLFPGNPGLPAALDSRGEPGCVAMQAPAAPTSRLSLNLPALLQTERLFLFVSGEAKLSLLQQALSATPDTWPVAALLAQRQVPVEIFWFP